MLKLTYNSAIILSNLDNIIYRLGLSPSWLYTWSHSDDDKKITIKLR